MKIPLNSVAKVSEICGSKNTKKGWKNSCDSYIVLRNSKKTNRRERKERREIRG